MSTITHITSTSHLSTFLSKTVYAVLDFHASWCGPCKQIAPIYEQLAASEAKPGRLAFGKVDVDAAQDVARQYGVTAMPTFLVIKNGTVTNTIRGANPSALRSAVMAASADAARAGPRQSDLFKSKGRTLGGAGAGAAASSGGGPWLGAQGAGGLADSVVRAAGLYVTTLLAFDSYAAAEASPFSVGSGR